ncbi:MAG: Asp-tRNA(Asn)/Glu-tRNA(Gln) amidotransferase GatCAB subunit C [Candidatus Omnitrophica bacterium CG11_big_fil_rev_8_21_14_0_20_63_9]|nr:MAG: Asp-tRNA(Asn)/Glu-tRNA(Gln) amidotransferase GatCAB subunit C [Candidatus Omnitrophica bacterium CG11_big_fil_rev_8_21_14_0_20_63_9]
MSLITPEIVKHVALLARLRLEGAALAQFAGQLDEILEYVKQLGTVSTDQVAPTSHVLPLSNVQRSDEPAPSLPNQTVLALAPTHRPPFVTVPKVIESA